VTLSQSFKILYLGHNYGTSLHRSDALRRIGHEVEVLDPWEFLPKGKFAAKIFGKLVYEIGADWLEPYVHHRLIPVLTNRLFDVIWSDQSELIGLRTVQWLKSHTHYLVTYAVDDPFGLLNLKRFLLYRKGLRVFDLFAAVRKPNVQEARTYGVKNVVCVFRSADEVAHSPVDLSPDDLRKWRSEVAFVGTWMPERGPILARLLDLGVPLTLYGDRWRKAPEWPIIRKAWHGPGLVGKDYVKAIQSAKICLGLLSKGNRDLHTQRSAEIPYIGSVLCAERTIEHQAMYQENEEAIFWDTPEACAQKCFTLLADEPTRQAIALAGRQRCIQSGYLNEPTVKRILDALPAQKGAFSERKQQGSH
jgi:spore maturation protein CgeB